MSYADRDRTGENTVGMIVSGLIIALVSYGLYLGMSVEGIRQAFKKLTTVEIKKDEPKKTPPPPPKPMKVPPPIVAPPPKINVSTAPPPVQTVVTPPPLPPPPVIVPPPPAAPPPPKFTPKGASPKGNPGSWMTNDDYPTGALRRGEKGTTGVRLTVGSDGRVTDCSVTSSSGSSELDSTACSLLKRRAKFSPATDGEGQPTGGSYTFRFKWVIPEGEG